MAALKAQTSGSPRKRSKPAVQPSLNAPQRAYIAEPRGPVDYDALSAEVADRFPHILKRLAE